MDMKEYKMDSICVFRKKVYFICRIGEGIGC